MLLPRILHMLSPWILPVITSGHIKHYLVFLSLIFILFYPMPLYTLLIRFIYQADIYTFFSLHYWHQKIHIGKKLLMIDWYIDRLIYQGNNSCIFHVSGSAPRHPYQSITTHDGPSYGPADISDPNLHFFLSQYWPQKIYTGQSLLMIDRYIDWLTY